MTPFIQNVNVELQYKFYENYVDYCHPNNPDCVTGVTCSDCNDGFNPHLIVASHLVTFANSPIIVVGEEKPVITKVAAFNANPNPTKGMVEIMLTGNVKVNNATVYIYNLSGKVVSQFRWDGTDRMVDLSNLPKGIYFMQLMGNGVSDARKIVLQ